MIENPKDSRYLGGYIGASIEHGDLSNAEIYLDRLDELLPNNISPVELRRSCWRRKTGRKRATSSSWTSSTTPMPSPKTAPSGRISSSRGFSTWPTPSTSPSRRPSRRSAGRRPRSCARPASRETPRLELQLAAQMVLEGKVDEGLDMLDQCLETSTANDVARAC